MHREHEIIQIVGKNPFLWHDHWPTKDYSRVFECLVLVEDISRVANKVVSKIREIGLEEQRRAKLLQNNINTTFQIGPYVVVHMRIEKDLMIHCKKLEQTLNVSEICSNKEQIMLIIENIVGLETPIVVYLDVADELLEDSSILVGWDKGFIPPEKKKLGVFYSYKNHPYLIQSTIDYEVCLRSDVFVGNNFSTFCSMFLIRVELKEKCGLDVRWPSYAYNLEGESHWQ